MEPDSSVPCAQQPDPCTILSQINLLHALPSFFLKIRFNNITIRSSPYVPPSVWQTKFHTHTKQRQNYNSVYLFIFLQQNILDRTVAGIPWAQSALNPFMWAGMAQSE